MGRRIANLGVPLALLLSKMGDYVFQLQKLCKTRMRRLAFVIGLMASVGLVFQSVTLPFRNAPPPYQASKVRVAEKRNLPSKIASPKSLRLGNFSLGDPQNSRYSSIGFKEVDMGEVSDQVEKTNHGFRIKIINENKEKSNDSDEIDLDEDQEVKNKIHFGLEEGDISKKVSNLLDDSLKIEMVSDPENIPKEKFEGLHKGSSYVSDSVSQPDPTLVSEKIKILVNESVTLQPLSSPVVSNHPAVAMASVIPSAAKDTKETVASLGKQTEETPLDNEGLMQLKGSATSNRNSTASVLPLVEKKRPLPPIFISNINPLLIRNRASQSSMRPQWTLACEKDLSAAKEQIENAPIVKNDQKLHAPLFQNISMFKRSYDLMERTLKIYVYKEGEKPIFHQPLLQGIYASEGWFMKLIETNTHFVVKDPRKAHLFYMPFSSRYLQSFVYVRELNNRRDLQQYLKNYVDVIAARYPFWNRTGGADHFLVACHDWVLFETNTTMERCIRALCVSDPRKGFVLGKDTSLPETHVRSPENPLKSLGGKPPNRRPILAFFAGNMHGSLRPVLLKHWENKDPDMKIFGPLPVGGENKISYAQYMKTSKYCICPRGHEVNSPRVVESIFYECVPVLISDNYVLPFFEVLNWSAFSIIVQERDVPRLKEILESIPQKKYLALQKAVRKVQQHFLWHNKPVKYDLFHMILHSIWLNRLYQISTG